ncbi:MAG: NAD-dependent epimerase/dehydratase family protein [Anaerolineales bacterium]
MSEKVFLTGGTGFLGHHLAPLLVQAGYHLRMLVRPTSDITWLPNGVELCPGDLSDRETLVAGMYGCSMVVHAAGLFRFWGRAEDFRTVNVEGLRNVAEAAVQCRVNTFVHVSSIAVVGKPPAGPFDESVTCLPQDAYQHSKWDGERLLRAIMARSGLPVVILRPGAFYGPGSTYGFNRLFILDPLRGLRVQVARGQRYIFPAYIGDVAQAVRLALQRGVPGQVYHICDRPARHAEVNRLVSELAGIPHWRLNIPSSWMIFLARLMESWAARTGREPFYPLNLQHYVFQDWQPTYHKAATELGFSPTPLRDGLRATLDYLKTTKAI